MPLRGGRWPSHPTPAMQKFLKALDALTAEQGLPGYANGLEDHILQFMSIDMSVQTYNLLGVDARQLPKEITISLHAYPPPTLEGTAVDVDDKLLPEMQRLLDERVGGVS